MNWTLRKEECGDAMRAVIRARSVAAAKAAMFWLLYAVLVGPTFWASEKVSAFRKGAA